ncbi:MAG: glycosyl transferase [Firmicutes bacterium HGW-Firmicutes-7]|nr:MAG: glycosyl transferase [Firmicutes bacterium HGW-Firmicutes-7]
MTISLCMIVRDEEKVLDRCLSSIMDVLDEIIVIDTGSKDKTIEIAKNYKAKIYHFSWDNNFASARNFAFSKATKDYILWLDADDILYPKELEKLADLKQALNGDIDAYSMIYHYEVDENENVLLSFRRNRLVRREKGFMWYGAVHEYLDIYGKTIDTDICITHKRIKAVSDRNLKIYEERLQKGIKLSTRDIYYYGKELYDHEDYERAIDYFLDFIDCEDAWIEEKIAACLKIARYYTWFGLYNQSRTYCYKTFEYGKPRPEVCCQMGSNYFEESKIEQAIYWYSLALRVGQDDHPDAFTNPACSSWLPHLQLCMCYYKLGDVQKAKKHNEEALKHNKNHESILFNQKFFDEIQ